MTGDLNSSIPGSQCQIPAKVEPYLRQVITCVCLVWVFMNVLARPHIVGPGQNVHEK